MNNVFLRLVIFNCSCNSIMLVISNTNLFRSSLTFFGNSWFSIYKSFIFISFRFKGAFSGLRQFLASEILLKMTKNAFYFTVKDTFVLKLFEFLF